MLFYNDLEDATDFYNLNGLKHKNDMLYPGHFLVAPSFDNRSWSSNGCVPDLIATENYHFRNSYKRPSAELYNNNFSLLNHLAKNNKDYDTTSQFFGGIDSYIGHRVSSIQKTLKDMNKTYNKAMATNVRLGSKEFTTMIKPSQDALRNQLTGFSKKAILRNADAKSMKDALQISHKSAQNLFRSNGSATQIKQISQAIGKAGNVAKYTKSLGVVGQVLSIGASVGEVKEAYDKTGWTGATKAAGREGAGLLGSVGAAAGTSALLLAFGVGTGGLGFIAAGVAVAGMSVLGQHAGKFAYDEVDEAVGLATDQGIEWLEKENLL